MRSQFPYRMRRLGTAACLALVVAGGAVLGAGTAAAAEPFVLESCSARIVGEPGQQISLRPSAVETPILAALAPLDPLGIIRPLFRQVWATLPPIPVGAVPGTGQVVIGGGAIADAVATQLLGLPVLAPVIRPLLDNVWVTIARTCGVIGEAVGAVTPPPPSPAPPAPAPGQPAPGQPAPGQPPAARPPAGQPTTPPAAPPARPPVGGGLPPEPVVPAPPVSPGSNVALEYPVEWKTRSPGLGLPPEAVAVLTNPQNAGSGQVPQFGVLGKDKPAARNAAGHATPLDEQSRRAVQGSVLLAALVLALVAAQWTRMWVLRRTAPAADGVRLGLGWRQLRVPLPVIKRD